MYNLTDSQKVLAKWLVKSVREEEIAEQFEILWSRTLASPSPQAELWNYQGKIEELPEISQGALDALMANNFLICEKIQNSNGQGENRRTCTLTGKIYEAVDNDFNAPDMSFIKYLTPLGDISGFDEELKQRCLPILGAGATDPMLWDSAVRNAGVVLEDRLRDVGSVSDLNITGQKLVNDLFGKEGILKSKFTVPSEREGYRDLYAGIIGTIRNPSAHRFIDHSPEEGGAIIMFVNLLLKKLEALR
jgi:Protein of unknown function (Hypoth_ymh)